MFLRQSTSINFVLGPFLNNIDGVTPETGLVISASDIRLSKNCGAFSAKNESTSAIHMENGYYSCSFNATDVGTAGRLDITIYKTGTLPVFMTVLVIPQYIYDVWISGTETLKVMLSASQPDYTPALQASLITDVAVITGNQAIIISKEDSISATQVNQALQTTLVNAMVSITGGQATIISKEDSISATEATHALQSTLVNALVSITGGQVTIISKEDSISANQAIIIAKEDSISATQVLQATEANAIINKNTIITEITTISGDVNTILTSAHGAGAWDAISESPVVLSASQPYYTPALEATLLSVSATLNGVNSKTTNLPVDPASNTLVSTRLAISAYTAPDNITIGKIALSATAIQGKTDALPVDPASETTLTIVIGKENSISASVSNLGSPMQIGEEVVLSASQPNYAPALQTTVLNMSATQDAQGITITAINSKTTNLPSDPASNILVGTRLATSAYTAPDNTTIGEIALSAIAIQAQTDKLLFNGSNFVKSELNAILSGVDFNEAMKASLNNATPTITGVTVAAEVILSATQPNYPIAKETTLVPGISTITGDTNTLKNNAVTIISKEDSISANNATHALQTTLVNSLVSITGNQNTIISKEDSISANNALHALQSTLVAGVANITATEVTIVSKEDSISANNALHALQTTLIAGVASITATESTIVSKEDSISANNALHALQSTLVAGIANISGNNATVISKEDSISATLSGINSKTTNLPSDPTSETSATANKNTILSSITSNARSAAREVWESVFEYKDTDGNTKKRRAWIMLQAIYSSLKQRMKDNT